MLVVWSKELHSLSDTDFECTEEDTYIESLGYFSGSDVRADVIYNTIQKVTGTAHFVSLAEFLQLGPYGGIRFGSPLLHGFLLRAW